MKKIYLLLAILLATGFQVFAQTHLVKGRVLDETGQGYPGAGVSVKGTQIGTVTDVDGNFQLNIPDDNNTLVIMAVGYNRQEVKVTGGALTVRITQATHELQGAVVTALAIKREKRELGYSASTISNQDLTSGNNTSALSAIQGKTAGANITSSTGGPGGSTRVVLRGEKSISGSNNALMVVDGVIINNTNRISTNSLEQNDFGNSGNDINPDDIESITVLKGPAAAALYGSQAANGAIMITTKSGKNRKDTKKTEITVKSSYTLSDVLKYPDLQHTYGQGNIYAGIADDRRENFSWGLPFDGQLRPWGQEINGTQKVKPYSDQPNNIKDFFNKGKTAENYISLAGGDEKSTYFVSLNALNNTGIVPNTYYDKYSIRFNGSTQLANNFYSSVNVNYIHIDQRIGSAGQATGSFWDNLLQTPRDIPIAELKNLNDVFNSYGYTDAQGVQRYGYYGAYTNNPYWIAQNFVNRGNTDRVIGSATIGYKSGDRFNIFDRIGADVTSDRFSFETPKINLQSFDPLYTDNPKVIQGGYEQSATSNMLINNDLIADYSKPLSDNIGMDLLAGNNLQVSNYTNMDANIDPKTNGLVVPGYYNLQNSQGPVIANNTTQQYKTIGLYGDFKLNYRQTLFLELTARNDWTSTLSENFRSYFYPSISTSWVFTEGMHGKFKDNVLSYGKLRASYASVGHGANPYDNNNPAYIATTAKTGFGSVIFPFNGQPGYTFQNFIGDPNLRPERTNSWEIGTDLSFFKNRISVEFTYYNSHTIDQIIATLPTAPSSGFTSQVLNVGDVQNKGIELGLRVTPISTPSGFRWELYGTYYQNNNEVLSLTNGSSQLVIGGYNGLNISAAVGHPYGAFYAIDLQRDPQGHVIIDPATGLPLSTPNPVYKGTYQPRFIASWGTNLSYKGFTLNVLFTTKQGGYFFSRDKEITDFNGTAAETGNRATQYFANSVYYDNTTGKYVTNDAAHNGTMYRPYDYFTTTTQTLAGVHILDASYVKLQEASIYYTIPEKYLHRTPFGGLSVGIFGNNLFIWTAKDNKYDDPEVSSGGASNEQGFNFSSQPSLRNYGASVKITF